MLYDSHSHGWHLGGGVKYQRCGGDWIDAAAKR